MQNIKELTLAQLQELLKSWQVPPYHAKQVFAWVYQRSAGSFSLMSDLPLDLRKKLEEHFTLFELKLVKSLESADGTEKLLLALKDNNLIEAVSIPAEPRVTGCISSQVGCKYACGFCASGLSGFKRNLSAAEMLDEIAYLKKISGNRLTHIVFMGTGEPLDNYDNVLRAVRAINSPGAFNIGARRITISTCGLVKGIEKLAREALQVELSVSLHAADDKTRDLIMPINRKYPLKTLIDACRRYIKETNRQITFEYILVKGLNSDLQNAKNMSRILKGLNCKVNLIPANPVKELGIQPPAKPDALFFRDALLKTGIHVTLRKPRGNDIDAACGQLRLNYEKK